MRLIATKKKETHKHPIAMKIVHGKHLLGLTWQSDFKRLKQTELISAAQYLEWIFSFAKNFPLEKKRIKNKIENRTKTTISIIKLKPFTYKIFTFPMT